jgi:hypothetical protein
MAAGGIARGPLGTLERGVVALMFVAGCSGASGTAGATQAASAAAPTTVATPAATLEPTAAPTAPVVTAGPTAAPIAACAAPPSGMVAWWRGEDWRDASGHNHPGGSSPSGFTFVDGIVGRAFSFNGTDQDVSVTAAELQLKAAITIEGWVYETGDQSGYEGIAGTWNDEGGNFRTYLLWVRDRTLEFIVSTDGLSYQRAAEVEPFPADGWAHVAGTYDGTTIRLYQDGVEVASAPLTGQIATNDAPFLFGMTFGGSVGANHWHGLIDELTVYKRALTAAEIAAIYGAGSAGKCLP